MGFRRVVQGLCCGVFVACTGTISRSNTQPGQTLTGGSTGPLVMPDGGRQVGIDGGAPPPPDNTGQITGALARLSRREIDAALDAVFGLGGVAYSLLPADADLVVNPATQGEQEVFDTLVGTLGTYLPSQVFVEAVANLAAEVGKRVAMDTPRVQALIDCTPTGPLDAGCMATAVQRLGLRLFRRPLEPDEQEALLAEALAVAQAEQDFYVGIRGLVQTLVSSPSFLYLVSADGRVHDGTVRITNFEAVTRMSMLFFGQPPDQDLLDQASGPELDAAQWQSLVYATIDSRRLQVLDHVERFHRMWLRYDRALVFDAALKADMLDESQALVQRVIRDPDVPWSDLFAARQTHVTPQLAAHYGMPGPMSEPAWVQYARPERAGLLSHGSFLSLSSTKTDGTLPSRRGAMIARRLLCVPILPPPPEVDVDDGVDVPEGACKSEAYSAHRQAGSACAGCHSLMDGIGFGFERFDGLGRFRTRERDNGQCTIDGLGMASGREFSGPRQFVAAVAAQGVLTRCACEQWLSFVLRRPLQGADSALVDRLQSSLVQSGDFVQVMVAVALDPAFRTQGQVRP